MKNSTISIIATAIMVVAMLVLLEHGFWQPAGLAMMFYFIFAAMTTELLKDENN